MFTKLADLLARAFSGAMTWWWWLGAATLFVAAAWWWYTASTPVRGRPDRTEDEDDDLST